MNIHVHVMCTRLFQRRRKGIHLRASSNLPHNIEESVSDSLTQNMQRVFKCAERTSKHNAAMVICHFHFRRTGPEPKKRMTRALKNSESRSWSSYSSSTCCFVFLCIPRIASPRLRLLWVST